MKWLMRVALLIFVFLVLIILTLFLGVVFDAEFLIDLAETGIYLFALLLSIGLLVLMLLLWLLLERFIKKVKEK